VKFIFATTEIRKIPVTILSRCQRFDLRRVETPMLAVHLKNIAGREAVNADDEALTLIADAAGGSVRDALSLLDQAIALGGDESGFIRAPAVRDMLGMNDKSQLFALLEKLLAGTMAEALAEFRRLYAGGADPAMLLADMLALVHYVTRIRITPESAEDVAFSEHERTFAVNLAGKLTIPTLTKLWQMLLKGVQEVRVAPEPLASAEMALIRIAHSADLPSPSDLIRILKKETSAVASNAGNPPPPRSPVSSLISTHQVAQSVAQAALAHAPMPQTFESAVQMFSAHREALLYNYLLHNVRLVAFEKGRIELNVDAEVPVDFAGRIGKNLTEWTGQRWLVALSHAAGAQTLQKQREAADGQKREAVQSHPLVAAVLEQFPGAKVTKVTD
jgi:DNA polymerase-3 subunit gamma/tau